MKRQVLGLLLFASVIGIGACYALRHKNEPPTEGYHADAIEDADEADNTDSLVAVVMKPHKHYRVIDYPTPNVKAGARNPVQGVVLHHTAEPSAERSLQILTSPQRGVGTHVVIDTDGTRYVLCRPDQVTFHAGPSILHGKESCNSFTVGIEFQGNTLERPLTDDQILSGIEYLEPLIRKYHIPLDNIVTHEMVRKAYKRQYPDRPAAGKVDITQREYVRFMKVLRAAVPEEECE